MDGMRIANQFLNGVLEPSSYEIVDHTYLSVIDKLVQFVTGVELTRPKAIGGHLGGLVAHILPFRLVISFSVPSRNSLGNVHALFDGLEGPMNDGWSCNYEFKACVTRELQQLFSESICAFHPRYIDILKDLNK